MAARQMQMADSQETTQGQQQHQVTSQSAAGPGATASVNAGGNANGNREGMLYSDLDIDLQSPASFSDATASCAFPQPQSQSQPQPQLQLPHVLQQSQLPQVQNQDQQIQIPLQPQAPTPTSINTSAPVPGSTTALLSPDLNSPALYSQNTTEDHTSHPSPADSSSALNQQPQPQSQSQSQPQPQPSPQQYDFSNLNFNFATWPPFAAPSQSFSTTYPGSPIPSSVATPGPPGYPAAWDLSNLSEPQQQLQLQQLQLQQLQSLFPFAPSLAAAAFPAQVAGSGLDGLSEEAIAKLTPAQLDRLKQIKMPPPHLRYHSPTGASLESPGSGEAHALSSSDHDAARSSIANKKRKAAAEEEEEEDDDDETGPVKKTAHNMIEKRYRTNLNDKIASLRDSVPSLRIMSKSARGEDTTEDREELHGLTPAHKLNKATVLSKATEYIRHLEKRNNRLIDENLAMQQRIQAFEKLFMAGAMNGTLGPLPPHLTPMQYAAAAAAAAAQDPTKYMNHQMDQSHRAETPAVGMIPVPDDVKRLIHAQMQGPAYPMPQQQFNNPMGSRQQTIQQQQQDMQQGRYPRNNANIGRLMVGSIAGLMILEALQEDEQSTDTPEGRGLFALPVSFVNSSVSRLSFSIMGHHVPASQVLLSVKLLLMVGTLVCVFAPDFFGRSTKTKQSDTDASPMTPLIASPEKTRKQIWANATRNMWLSEPRNAVFEILAVVVKAFETIAFLVLGSHNVQMLSRRTDREEKERVDAWSTIIDAQLSGGDDQISSPRLLYTFLSSLSLENTPAHLMRKSLHATILGSATHAMPFATFVFYFLARSYWNAARDLHLMLGKAWDSYANLKDSDYELFEHLSELLLHDYEDVFTPEIIKKAQGWAFNNASCGVVEDEWAQLPLDAVSAWWSEFVLNKTLMGSLSSDMDSAAAQSSTAEEIDLALKTAPAGSRSLIQATIARALLVHKKRGLHIATAMKLVDQSDNASDELSAALQSTVALALLRKSSDNRKPISVPMYTISSCKSVSLLGLVSNFKVLEALFAQLPSTTVYRSSVELMAGSLRVWIGGRQGASCGLSEELRMDLVDRCLGIAKAVVGMDVDSGYGSNNDQDAQVRA